MVNHYYYKVLDKWLLDEINDILNYFTIKDGKVKMIKNLSEYKPTNISKDSDEIAEKKIDYIQQKLFSKHDMADILFRFVKETNTKWTDLPKNEYFLRQIVKSYFLKKIKSKLKKKDNIKQ